MPVLLQQHLRGVVSHQPVLLNTDGLALSSPALIVQIERLRQALIQHGIGRGKRVAFVLPNGLPMAVAFLAITCTATAAPLNPKYQKDEFSFFLKDLRADALLMLAGTDSSASHSAREAGIPLLELEVQPGSQPVFTLRGESGQSISDKPVQPEDIALILHTSGTTARPKMVPLLQRNLFASAQNITRSLQLATGDRCLNLMPLFHIHGLMAGLVAPLAAGGSVVCPPAFAAAAFFGWLERFSPTWYTAVPSMHQAILSRAKDFPAQVQASRLRLIRSCSAFLAPQTMAALEETFQAPVINSYGMTEASHQMASHALPPGLRKPGTVGFPAGPEMTILHLERLEALDRGQVGEVAIRGENVMPGYLENPEANAAAFTAGWLRTGDLGYFDEDGCLHLEGRKKEMINRGGEKIAPAEIDQVLLAHPAVAQAVVFGVPDPSLGEEVAAAVVLQPGIVATEREIQQFIAMRLADFKIPRRIVFLDEIPKGPTGKIQRIGLAQRLGLPSIEPLASAEDDLPRAEADIEAFVAELWRDLLQLDEFELHDRFAALGGDSLTAMRLVGRLNASLGIDLTVLDFFNAGTVIAQASIVQQKLLVQLSDSESS